MTSRTREVVAHTARAGGSVDGVTNYRGARARRVQMEGTRGKTFTRTVCACVSTVDIVNAERKRGEEGAGRGAGAPRCPRGQPIKGASERASEQAKQAGSQAGKKSARVARVSYTGATHTRWWGWARAAGLQLPLCIAPLPPSGPLPPGSRSCLLYYGPRASPPGGPSASRHRCSSRHPPL